MASHDVVAAIAVDVTDGERDAAAEGRSEGVAGPQAGQRGAVQQRDEPAARAHAREDVGHPVAGEVAGADSRAAAERTEREPGAKKRTVGPVDYVRRNRAHRWAEEDFLDGIVAEKCRRAVTRRCDILCMKSVWRLLRHSCGG